MADIAMTRKRAQNEHKTNLDEEKRDHNRKY